MTLFEKSTYQIPLTVSDVESGEPLNLTSVTNIAFVMAESRGGAAVLERELGDTHDSIEVTDAESGEVLIEIDAEHMDVPRTVWEEFRVDFSDRSAVVLQRKVDFERVTTEPQ